MIVTLAVYSREQESALRLLRWINELGGVQFHTLVIGTTYQTRPEPLLEEAAKGWGNVEHFVIKANQEVQEWPQGNNANFKAVCEYMNDRGRAFFFMESDVLPLCASWLDKLEHEYQTAAMPFMGEVHAMLDPANGKHLPGTEHMNGSGIYPAGVLGYLPTLPYVTKEPWDVALRFEMMSLVDRQRGGFKAGNGPLGRVAICHPTGAICFCWRTKNYRREGERFLYDTDGPAHHRELDLSRHILHHGCKDESLMNLMREVLFGPRQPQEPKSPAPVAPPTEPEVFDPTRGQSTVVREVMRVEMPAVDAAEKKIADVMALLGVDRGPAIAAINAANSYDPAGYVPPTGPERLPRAAFRRAPRAVAKKKRGRPKQKPAAATPAPVPPVEPSASTEPATAAT